MMNLYSGCPVRFTDGPYHPRKGHVTDVSIKDEKIVVSVRLDDDTVVTTTGSQIDVDYFGKPRS